MTAGAALRLCLLVGRGVLLERFLRHQPPVAVKRHTGGLGAGIFENIPQPILIGIGIVGVLLVGIILKNAWFVGTAFILLLLAHAWRNNTMMAYVEDNAFDGSGKYKSFGKNL